jgi:DNA-binding transcriptional ArsR family regulator
MYRSGGAGLVEVTNFDNYRIMEVKAALAAFSALSQEVRLTVLKRLVEVGPGGVAAGALAEAAGVAAPTMSFHLKELAGAGLVRARKDGRSVIYAADYGGIRALVEFLLADCCRGDARLCGPYVVKDCA